MLDKIARAVRHAILWVVSNEALFFLFAFISADQSLLHMEPVWWYRDVLDPLIGLLCIPWGLILCVLRLERRAKNGETGMSVNVAILFVLLFWLTVPFAYRFGLTSKNQISWYNHTVLFFGLYATVSEEYDKRLESTLDCASSAFALLSLVLTIPTLYSIINGVTLWLEVGGLGFGPSEMGYFQFGLHYNHTAIAAVCCALLTLIGFCRRKNPLLRLAHLALSAFMMLVVVLTQSRTSRYALLGALAVGCFGLLSERLPIRLPTMRYAAALLCAVAVLPVGFFTASNVTVLALEHYANVRSASYTTADDSQSVAAVSAETETASEPQPTPVTVPEQRAPIDATLSLRTVIWKNLFNYWKANPKYLLIGNGSNRSGSLIVDNLPEEEYGNAVSVHNAYLQFIADYGLINFAILAIFLAMHVPVALRVLLAPKGISKPGDRVLVMIIVAQLLIGLTESPPLGAMTTSNLSLFFSLAVLQARSRQLSTGTHPA